MSDKQFVNIFYEGADYKDGKIDIKELAPSLLAFGDLLNEVNQIINNGKADIQTYITATEKKCFKCKISLESASIFESIKEQFGFVKYLSLKEMLELIGFIGAGTSGIAGIVVTSYLVYKKIEQGRKIKKHTILQDNNVTIELEDSTTITVSFDLFRLVKASWQKKYSIKKNLDKHLSNAKSDIGYSLQDNEKPQYIKKEEKELLLKKDYNLEANHASQDPIYTTLLIRQPDYYGDIKWSFIYAGKTIKPDFDNIIKEKLNAIKKNIVYNSKIPVKMTITYEEDERGEAVTGTEEYRILEITGDIIKPVQNEELKF
jgi:Holliday junction resolvase RusA-like endonuclease